MIDIYNGYTTNEVLLDEPYVDKYLKLYPIKVNQYKEFNKYLHYILYSKKHYSIKDSKIKFLDYVIALNVSNYKQQIEDKSNMELIEMVLKDLSNIFTIACREDVFIDVKRVEDEVVFINKDKTIQISNKNFNKARVIILKQNAILEPKIFDSEEDLYVHEKWMEAQKNKNKKNIKGFGEMANLISCSTSKSYEMLQEENILQFYADYYRCINTISSKGTTTLKTAFSDIDIVNYTDEIISEIYKDPYEGMFKDFNSFMGGIN